MLELEHILQRLQKCDVESGAYDYDLDERAIKEMSRNRAHIIDELPDYIIDPIDGIKTYSKLLKNLQEQDKRELRIIVVSYLLVFVVEAQVKKIPENYIVQAIFND